jgi:LmbE family N-acetylglucosaminyl deacetylase
MKQRTLSLAGSLRRYLPMARAGEVLAALSDLPFVFPHDLLNDQPVLVLAPHPDDESLGCGGLIADCQARGQSVHVLVLTDGSRSHPNSREYDAPRLAQLRREEARAAVAALGLPGDSISFLGLADGRAPMRGRLLRAAVARVAAQAKARSVGTICTTWQHDPHHDHRAAYRIGQLAAREVAANLLCYPVWGWTLPSTVWLATKTVSGGRVDISRHLSAKQRAIACYRSQTTDLIRDDPTGFRLTPEFLTFFTRPFEVLITA